MAEAAAPLTVADVQAGKARKRSGKKKRQDMPTIDLSEWKGANAKLRQIRGRVRKLTEADGVTMQQVQGFIRFVARVVGS